MIEDTLKRAIPIFFFGEEDDMTSWSDEVSSGAAASLDLSGLPAFRYAQLHVWVTDNGVDSLVPCLRFNDDTGSNYFFWNGDPSAGTQGVSQDRLNIARQGSLNDSSIFSVIDIFNEAKTEFASQISLSWRTFRYHATTSLVAYWGGGSWADAGPITKITLLDNGTDQFASARMRALLVSS